MRRLFSCCIISLCLYVAAFALVIDRPLSLGALDLEIQQKTFRLEGLPSPKLVILAGSNGPYSHSCAVIGPMLRLPCENAGIAVGIGLDDLFARYARSLRPGDIVYMPMEARQYTMTRAENDAGADGAILLRHDPGLLRDFPPDRIIGAVFSSNFLDLIEALAEMPMPEMGVLSAAKTIGVEYDAQGDRVGTALETADQAILRDAAPRAETAHEIETGYGTVLIGDFVARESRRGVAVIGGLPTRFTSDPLPTASIAAIRGVYVSNGGEFVRLSNDSLYPIVDFYDSADHLAQPCQYLHSIAIAQLLGNALGRQVTPPAKSAADLANACPKAGLN